MEFKLGEYQQGSPHESDAGWPITLEDPVFGSKRVAFVIDGDIHSDAAKWVAEFVVKCLNNYRREMAQELAKKGKE